jgi:4-hydroxybenzoate polyprenyltransferase
MICNQTANLMKSAFFEGAFLFMHDMKTVNQLIDFFVYSNTVIGLAAVGLVFTFAQVSGSIQVDNLLLLFVFSLIVCLYGWLKYKESRDGSMPSTTHRQWYLANYPLAVLWMSINAILVLVLSYQVPKTHQFAIGALAFFSVLYVVDFKYSIRRLALVKPFDVALIWSLLVILMTHDVWVQFSADLVYLAVLLFLLLSVLLLLFEIKDQETDKAHQLTTWPIRFGVNRTKYLACFLAFVLILTALYGYLTFERLLPLNIAVVVQSLVLFSLIKLTTAESNDRWYFFVLDGSLLLLPFFYFLHQLQL